MSILYLQGLFATKQNNFEKLRELADFSGGFELRMFDSRFRETLLKRLSSRDEASAFLKQDIEFHLKAIRSQNEAIDKRFLHGILLDFDAQKLSNLKSGQPSESLAGYFTNDELSSLLKENFFQSLGDTDVKIFLADINHRNHRAPKKSLRDFQKELLMAHRFDFINNYLEIENLIETRQKEKLKRHLPLHFTNIIAKTDDYDLELMKLYLPWLLTRGLIFLSGPYESVFAYLKARFMFWKIINPYIV